MTFLRRAATKDIVLIVVALVLVAGAVYLYSRLSKSGQASEVDMVYFFCDDCKVPTEISQLEFERRWDRKEFKAEQGGSFWIKCSKCGKMTAERRDKESTAPQTEEEVEESK